MQFRIVVVGEGREKFGHVFLADTGTSNGDITGQTRPINTVGMYFVKSKRDIRGVGVADVTLLLNKPETLGQKKYLLY